MNKIEFKINQSNNSDILEHLKKCNDQFIPPLSSRVSIDEYSVKIFEKAIRFELWDGLKLIGLTAAYKNNESNSLFITNVSVEKEFSGNGLANKLIEEVINYCKTNGYKSIKLEVKKNNFKAISLYTKFNFKTEKEQNDSLFLGYTNLN
ncbi:MAG: GNAT family N-acetyltransferase [Bacteroidia bacterium]|nr:GNAT family N-acetyltransferase [Bacteroidia bacterium]